MMTFPQNNPQLIPHKRKLFVIIVHYNKAKKTKKAIASLLAGSRRPDHIIVVNQGKKSFQYDEKGSLVSVVCLGQNYGYAGGINIGIGSLIKYGPKIDDIVICMNNDIYVTKDALSLLEKWWKGKPSKYLVGVRIKEGKNIVLGQGNVNLMTGRTNIYKQPTIKTSMFYLSYIHGAFFSAPYSLYLKAQGVSQKYFMYWEDVLFSQTAIKKGYQLAIASKVIVKHDEHPMSAQQIYYLVRNGASFLESKTPQPFKALWFVGNRIRYIYHLLKPKASPVVLGALRDNIKKVQGPQKNKYEK